MRTGLASCQQCQQQFLYTPKGSVNLKIKGQSERQKVFEIIKEELFEKH